jgi:hypothetical protein
MSDSKPHRVLTGPAGPSAEELCVMGVNDLFFDLLNRKPDAARELAGELEATAERFAAKYPHLVRSSGKLAQEDE